MAESKRLMDVLPSEFMDGDYESSPAMPYAFTDIVAAYRRDQRPWPGSHRHVDAWFVLANGKAVGWNVNPSRGWSFPVINYRETDQPIVEVVTLHFESALHQRYHRVLVQFGFTFSVSSTLLIGLDYKHPDKPVSVMLKSVDDDLEHACLKPDGVHAYTKDDYSDAEWAWINDDDLGDVKALEHELHVLIQVRPATMFFPASG